MNITKCHFPLTPYNLVEDIFYLGIQNMRRVANDPTVLTCSSPAVQPDIALTTYQIHHPTKFLHSRLQQAFSIEMDKKIQQIMIMPLSSAMTIFGIDLYLVSS